MLGDGEPLVHVSVHDRRAYGAARSSVGLAESYMRGWWDCDDLTALVRVLLRSTTAPRRGPLRPPPPLAGPVLDPIALLRRRDGAADRSHVRAHYDLGNDFFAPCSTRP